MPRVFPDNEDALNYDYDTFEVSLLDPEKVESDARVMMNL